MEIQIEGTQITIVNKDGILVNEQGNFSYKDSGGEIAITLACTGKKITPWTPLNQISVNGETLNRENYKELLKGLFPLGSEIPDGSITAAKLDPSLASIVTNAVLFDDSNNVPLRLGTKILGKTSDASEHEIAGLAEYSSIISMADIKIGTNLRGMTVILDTSTAPESGSSFNSGMLQTVKDSESTIAFGGCQITVVRLSYTVFNYSIAPLEGGYNTIIKLWDSRQVSINNGWMVDRFTFPDDRDCFVITNDLNKVSLPWNWTMSSVPAGTKTQTEFGTKSVHFNANTNDDPDYGTHITVDTPYSKEVVSYFSDFTHTITGTEKGLTTTDKIEIEQSIAEAQLSGTEFAAYFFGKLSNPAIVIPAPTDVAQNYFDFLTNTPYTAADDLSGWVAGEVFTPPSVQGYINITSKMYGVVEADNQGGHVDWIPASQTWNPHPWVFGSENFVKKSGDTIQSLGVLGTLSTGSNLIMGGVLSMQGNEAIFTYGATYSSVRGYSEGGAGAFMLQSSGVNCWVVGRHLRPVFDATRDIGNSSDRLRDVYIAGNLSDGTNTTTITELVGLKNSIGDINTVLDQINGEVI